MPDDPNQPRTALDRRAARVLPVNHRDEVLLLRGFEPAHPDDLFWFSVGGGLDEGEDDRQAAVRELWEETRIRATTAALVGPLLSETVGFSWGRYDITQQQTWWAVRVGDVPVSFEGLDEVERATTVEHRWWSATDLDASDQTAAPGLVEQIRMAVAAC
ncbi:8-oxo-dGTP pyrophosphatase MutT (NUDIX family) [Friedmanniella endophytica]|uniref:8-oxo-dGTP pyrophosphatase MutT (NUDIX family) n=1 Tax=Microlunatus kandeliicorticis TaxID=1759536 RepID=A0A7W3P5J9_9ACTN|nr:NUDIX domain-containing protein [Microlunatus kandeliicorticis]MBA8793947.1 8-oxo-dGTP pyrophosphatase MutT (NUDIX family) [Microlunatus kandeliicorticis]